MNTARPRPQTAARPILRLHTPFISVIVPVRNEERFIESTLRQLVTQEYDPERFEIIVADGRSTDRTREIVAALQAQFPQVTLLDNPGRLSSAGRNVAVEAARGDLIVLIDGHCDLDNPHYLADIADAFARSGADCVGRPQPLDVTGATPLQRAVAVARSSRLGHHPASHIYSDREGFVPPQSVAVAYRREVFNVVGAFDDTFDACEDVEFNHRVAAAGMRCFFTPHVQVRYFPRATLKGVFSQLARYGRGRVRLLRKHPGTFSPAVFVPALFLAGVVLGPLAGIVFPTLFIAYFTVIAVYALAVFGFSATAAMRERSLSLLPWLVAVYPMIHFGAGVGVWWEVMFRGAVTASGVRPAAIPETGRKLAA
jgi:succinoglycan biosynthesis protein ExoA